MLIKCFDRELAGIFLNLQLTVMPTTETTVYTIKNTFTLKQPKTHLQIVELFLEVILEQLKVRGFVQLWFRATAHTNLQPLRLLI